MPWNSPMPELWKWRSDEKLRRFNASRWPCISLAKAERRRSGLLKVRISPCVYISAIFDSLLHFNISHISGNKRKEKKQIMFLFTHLVICSSLQYSILCNSQYWEFVLKNKTKRNKTKNNNFCFFCWGLICLYFTKTLKYFTLKHS